MATLQRGGVIPSRHGVVAMRRRCNTATQSCSNCSTHRRTNAPLSVHGDAETHRHGDATTGPRTDSAMQRRGDVLTLGQGGLGTCQCVDTLTR